ncbi:MAG: FecR domain-containing protein [Acidobacteriota bacterium]|nr:FecR domain-containing protein [Acidobacteriota bacterium]
MGPLPKLDLFGPIPLILGCSIAMMAAPPSTGSARPWTMNAITGEVSINGAPVNPFNAAPLTLEPGRRIRTGQGMAEILLSPGSFLRIGKWSELLLENTGTCEIRTRLQRGEALVEVLDPGAALTVEQDGVTAIVRNPGLYEFNQERSVVAVYAGQALLNKDDQQLVATAGLGVGTRCFRVFRTNPDPSNALLSWSRSRSEQLSMESRLSAQENSGAARSRGPQWLWDPWSASYTSRCFGICDGTFRMALLLPRLWRPIPFPGIAATPGCYGPPVLSSPDLTGGSGLAQPFEPE